MPPKRLSLVNYDVLRELCDQCRREAFHFVPSGSDSLPEPTRCSKCGSERKLADVSDTAIVRLIMQPDGEMKIVPRIAK